VSRWVLLRQRAASRRGRIVSRSLVYAVGSMLPNVVSMLLLPVFTRFLTAAEYGILAYSLTVAMFFSAIGAFSIQPFIVREYWRALPEGRTGALLGTTYAFLLVYNAALLAIASLVLPAVFKAFQVQVPFDPYVKVALYSAALQSLALVPMTYLRATEQATAYVSFGFVSSLLNAGLSLYFVAALGMGILGRLYGQLLAELLLLVMFLIVMSKIAAPAWDGRYIGRAARFCLPIIPAQLLALVAVMVDRLVLERSVPLSQLGVYSVAAAISATAPLLSSGVYAAIQPQIFRMASEAAFDERILVVKRYIVWLLMLLMMLVIGLSRDAVFVLAGPEFRESYKVAPLLVAGILIQSYITNVPSQYLTAIGKTHYETPSRIVGAVVSLVVMLLLVPIWGIYGAGLASILTALATLGAYRLFLRRESSINWRFAPDVALLGGAAAAGYLLSQIDLAFVLVSVTLKLLIVGLVAIAFLWRASPGMREFTSLLRAGGVAPGA
jgi:O-antigen/teichoic acid export membrane protein